MRAANIPQSQVRREGWAYGAPWGDEALTQQSCEQEHDDENPVTLLVENFSVESHKKLLTHFSESCFFTVSQGVLSVTPDVISLGYESLYLSQILRLMLKHKADRSSQ